MPKNWSAEEEADLKWMNTGDFIDKWGRSRQAIISRKIKLGIDVTIHHPPRKVTNPNCVYCSTQKGECTCDIGDRCRDSLCAYF